MKSGAVFDYICKVPPEGMDYMTSAKESGLTSTDIITGCVHLISSNEMVRHLSLLDLVQNAEEAMSGNDAEWTSQNNLRQSLFRGPELDV